MAQKKPELDPGKILNEAIYLLNEEGIDSVTTRKIAARLNVQSPALYWHYKNKQELLSAVREYIVEDCVQALRQRSDKQWDVWLTYIGVEMRKAMLKYRDINQLMSVAPMSERTQNELIPSFYQPLINRGFSEATAISAVTAVMSFTSGWVGYEQSAPIHAFMESMLDIETSFEFGLETIIIGFQERFKENNVQ